VSGHFRYRAGSGIRSFGVGLFQVLSCIGSERVERVSQIGSGSATSRIILPFFFFKS
jgi:hypothetical protein